MLSRQDDTSSSLVNTSDRKSTRLNSSHLVISYAVFCLKKKKKHITTPCPAILFVESQILPRHSMLATSHLAASTITTHSLFTSHPDETRATPHLVVACL